MFGSDAPHISMSDSSEQNHDHSPKDERVFPIFYKKKIFPLEKTRALEEQMEELLRDNDQNIANEKVMLDKIRERDDAFVASLGIYLEQFKNENVQEVIFIKDMLPEWSPQKKEPANPEALTRIDAEAVEDSVERLIEWYEAMETYVNVQRDGANQTIGDWFTMLDKISNEGEPDANAKDIEDRFAVSKQVNHLINRVNVFWCLFLIFICLLNVYLVYKPEDVQKCTNDPAKCIVNNMIKFCVFVHDHYLAFHDIPLENSPATSLNSSVTVSSEDLTPNFLN